MNRSCLAVIVVVMTTLTASCASHQGFPANWTLPEPASGEDCPNISGRYVNSGETISGNDSVALRFQWFWKDLSKYPVPLGMWRNVSEISLQQEGQNHLSITAWAEGKVLYSETLSKYADGFVCEEGWLKIRASSGGGTSGGMWTSHWVRGFSNAGGHLLEKEEYEGFAMLLVIPIVGSGTRWYRFQRIEEPKLQQ